MIFAKKIYNIIDDFGLNLSSASADESAELVVEGQPILTRTKAPSHMENIDELDQVGPLGLKTQALQMDDFENPGMIFVDKE